MSKNQKHSQKYQKQKIQQSQQKNQNINNPKNNQLQSNSSKQKEKPGQYDKYYQIKADFNYLKSFNYKIISQIGRGGYGVVYKAIRINKKQDSTAQHFAIKINFKTVSRELIYSQMAYLKLVTHKPNLPKIVNLFVFKDITHIVLEYFKYKPFIGFFTQFKLEDVKHYIFELLVGLKSLKDIGIYHRDIKPGNFLYNPQTKRGMIVDFGLAEIDPRYPINISEKIKYLRQIEEGDNKQCKSLQQTLKVYKRLVECLKLIGRNKIGTETYMPLQSILHHPTQGYPSDIWPVGVILLQFVTKKYTIFNSVRMINKPQNVKSHYYINFLIQLANFFGEDVIRANKKFGYQTILPKDALACKIESFKQISNLDGFDDNLNDLIYQLLKVVPQQRIKVQDALKHPFLDTVRQQHLKNLPQDFLNQRQTKWFKNNNKSQNSSHSHSKSLSLSFSKSQKSHESVMDGFNSERKIVNVIEDRQKSQLQNAANSLPIKSNNQLQRDRNIKKMQIQIQKVSDSIIIEQHDQIQQNDQNHSLQQNLNESNHNLQNIEKQQHAEDIKNYERSNSQENN